jgi:hypothetical protein
MQSDVGKVAGDERVFIPAESPDLIDGAVHTYLTTTRLCRGFL